MANRTVKDAHSIHGTNPQYLVEKIIRTRIYESKYWKEECFGLTGEWSRSDPLIGRCVAQGAVRTGPLEVRLEGNLSFISLSAYWVPRLVLGFGHTDDRALFRRVSRLGSLRHSIF